MPPWRLIAQHKSHYLSFHVQCNTTALQCKKPTLCPKPKCELQCERSACEAADDVECCPCSEGPNAQAAVDEVGLACLYVFVCVFCQSCSVLSAVRVLRDRTLRPRSTR
jgi:hypothetical protein